MDKLRMNAKRQEERRARDARLHQARSYREAHPEPAKAVVGLFQAIRAWFQGVKAMERQRYQRAVAVSKLVVAVKRHGRVKELRATVERLNEGLRG